jgi:hypothetical protein
MARVRVGDRVRVTGVMKDDPSPMEVGAEGTITHVNEGYGIAQYGVAWDNGRTLMLLPEDPFIVLGGGGAHRKPDPT